MRLERLYRAVFTYPEEGGAALEGGLERHVFVAEGRCEGGVTGRHRGLNHPFRRPDGTFCPDFQGAIETDDGATILFDWRGYGRAYPPGRRQIVGWGTHLCDDERYRPLAEAMCVLEGEVRARDDGSGADLVVDVYALAP